jgi:hypothetical protein
MGQMDISLRPADLDVKQRQPDRSLGRRVMKDIALFGFVNLCGRRCGRTAEDWAVWFKIAIWVTIRIFLG